MSPCVRKPATRYAECEQPKRVVNKPGGIGALLVRLVEWASRASEFAPCRSSPSGERSGQAGRGVGEHLFLKVLLAQDASICGENAAASFHQGRDFG